MFLNELNQNEKDNFISLAIDAANANGELADEEYLMLQEYCREMGLAYFEADKARPLDEIIDTFSASSERIKNVVVFEMLGLLVADGNFDEKEKEFLKQFSNGIGIDDNKVDFLKGLLKDYMDVVRKISDSFE